MSAEAFTLPVKSVTFTRHNGSVGITIVPEKQPEGQGELFMFGVDIDEGAPMAHALQALWDRALKV